MSVNNRITLLPDSVKHMIAAGEVVEGPSSIIKECIENAIDAESAMIVIEAEESGFKKILIRDNGFGIYKEDLPLAVAEHATSKIRKFSDIQTVSSLGFRGEALSSIAAVSECTILSRREEESVGGRAEIKNGKLSVSDYAGARGTTIIVENLFYNVPARKKFQKSISGESRSIRETVIKSALSAYHVGFDLSINGRRSLFLESAKSREERIAQIFGNDEKEGLTKESVNDIKVKIEGFISRPHFMKASRSEQFLFVNNRPVEMKHFSFLLSRAYESAAPQGRYPAAFIFIDIQPELVDVNIHPAKREIKFFDQRYVEGLIVSLIRKSLAEKGQLFDLASSATPVVDVQDVPENKNTTDVYKKTETVYTSSETAARDFKIRDMFVEPAYESSQSKDDENDSSALIPDTFTVLGMVFGTYIIADTGDELKILDFHAAHERINYDAIRSNNSEPDRQNLVFPEVVELPRHRYDDACELLDELNKKGFDVEPFSETSLIIRAVPSLLGDSSVKDFFTDLIDTFGSSDDSMAGYEHHVAARIACHASRRRNDHLSREEMAALFQKISSGSYALTCPHGRPYLYTVKRSEFEKMFRR
jgi:DNA mismatch repair protein MutL